MRIAVLAATAALLVSSAAALAATGPFQRSRTPEATQPHPAAPPGATQRRPAEPTEGTWTLQAREDGTMQMGLHFGTSNWGRPIDRADLVGLTDAQVAAAVSTPVAFRIDREAGVFDLEGAFHEGRGAGHFRFTPNRAFPSVLRGMGVRDADRIEDGELMVLALGGASSATLRELAGVDVRPRTVEEVVQLALFDITPAYVREVRGLFGGAGTEGVEEIVEMRIHDVSAALVRELAEMGFRGLSRDEVMQMGIHGVDADHVNAFRALGFDLTAEQAVELKIHGVTPEYVREMRAAGFTDLSADALSEMHVHGVTAAYVQSLADAGYRGLDRDLLMQMGIHGVTPEFIREVRAAGFTDLSPEALVEMRIHGIGAEYGRRTRG